MSKKVLPNWKPNENRVAHLGMLEPPFIHQSVCPNDPMLIFSRDVVHQKKPPGPYEKNPADY